MDDQLFFSQIETIRRKLQEAELEIQIYGPRHVHLTDQGKFYKEGIKESEEVINQAVDCALRTLEKLKKHNSKVVNYWKKRVVCLIEQHEENIK